MVSSVAAVWKAVDEKIALIRGGAVSTLDAGVVVFRLVATVSVDYDVCRGVSATGGAEGYSEEKGEKNSHKRIKVEIIILYQN